MKHGHPQYISTADLSRFLGISVVAVNKRIKTGRIKAIKIGRSYAISRKYIEEHYPDYPRLEISPIEYVSVMEAARLLNVTRMTVFNRIKRGELSAKKVGRHYVLPKDTLIVRQIPDTQPVVSRDYVSIMELAELTGRSRKTLFRYIKEGKIKARRLGRHYVIAREDIPLAGFVYSKAKQKVEDYYSVVEAAAVLGISRVAVFKKIKKGQIKAERMGRSYSILKVDVEKAEAKKI